MLTHLLDVYDNGEEMTLWFVDDNGKTFCCHDTFRPTLYALPHSPSTTNQLTKILKDFREIEALPSVMNELLRGPIQVLSLKCATPNIFRAFIRRIKHLESIEWFTCDVPLAQYYLAEKKWFCGSLMDIECSPDHHLIKGRRLESSWDYAPFDPPFRCAMIHGQGGPQDPYHADMAMSLCLTTDDKQNILEGSLPEQIESLNRFLHEDDPDIVITRNGDDFLIPHLNRIARLLHMPLNWNRDPNPPEERLTSHTQQRSYFSYGKIIYKPGMKRLYGRLHVDRDHCFLLHDTPHDPKNLSQSLIPFFELGRITKAPLQEIARASIGTGLSALQISQAINEHLLIPAQKQIPESWKSLSTLFQSDKGGLVYQPRPGFYEKVAQLDFSSMYPWIMIKRNISPETMNCECCQNHEAKIVPEIGLRICAKKQGFIPRVLKPLVEKRQSLKTLKAATTDPLIRQRIDSQQTCHKWLLVTCFGYLGYKNARFGRIEAHESVTAWGREALLTAKDIAEENGFRFYHAIVDCLWLQKSGATITDYEQLADRISAAVGIPMSVDGIYRWIIFSHSRIANRLSVANRYAGAFEHGEIKIRGLEQRRHDTALFIKQFQEWMMERLKNSASANEYKKTLPLILNQAKEVMENLETGRIPFSHLLIHKNLRRDPFDYRVLSPSACASQQLFHAGKILHAGQRVSTLFVNTKARNPFDRSRPSLLYDINDGIDVEKYRSLLCKSIEAFFYCFGITAETIETRITSSGYLQLKD